VKPKQTLETIRAEIEALNRQKTEVAAMPALASETLATAAGHLITSSAAGEAAARDALFHTQFGGPFALVDVDEVPPLTTPEGAAWLTQRFADLRNLIVWAAGPDALAKRFAELGADMLPANGIGSQARREQLAAIETDLVRLESAEWGAMVRIETETGELPNPRPNMRAEPAVVIGWGAKQ